MINVFQPSLSVEELEAVRRVFESNWTGKGKLTAEFEDRFAQWLGVSRANVRSVNSCTEGLFQSMGLLGIGPGDEVVLPTVSFVGAANAVAASGATPVFCDVDPRTLNPTLSNIEQKITPRTRAIMVLHYGGLPCEMDELVACAAQRGLAVIEDSACSVASRYRGRACGTIGDIGTWSFDSMKILVTGDGGMIYCRDPERAQRAEESMYLGLVTRSGYTSALDKKWWEFEISCFGRRSVMNDVSSSIGLEQLKKLDSFIARRREIHSDYDRGLEDIRWLERPPAVPAHCESSHYFYWVQTAASTRDALAAFLRDRGIYTTFRYYPLHLVRYYGSTARLPEAERAAATTLCLPLHQSLSNGDVDAVLDAIRAFGRSL